MTSSLKASCSVTGESPACSAIKHARTNPTQLLVEFLTRYTTKWRRGYRCGPESNYEISNREHFTRESTPGWEITPSC